MKIKLSQKQWLRIGQIAGWTPQDPIDISDEDIEPIYTPEEEEEALLGPEEAANAYQDGEAEGYDQRKVGKHDTTINPYRVDTKAGQKKFDEWLQGFENGWNKRDFEEATGEK